MNVIEQLADFESQLNYVSKVLQYSMLSVWEKKEYLDLKFEYSKKITQLKKYIKANNLKFQPETPAPQRGPGSSNPLGNFDTLIPCIGELGATNTRWLHGSGGFESRPAYTHKLTGIYEQSNFFFYPRKPLEKTFADC